MSFRTEIAIPPYDFRITYQDQIFCIGSCFAEAMGKRLAERKFSVSNPFGTTFNPLSIFRLLKVASQIEEIDTSLFVINQEQVAYHYDFHSSWRSQEIDLLQKDIAQKIPEIIDFLDKSQYVFITFGTAWVYELKAKQRLVNNCHKMPAHLFTKRLLSIEEIMQDFQNIERHFSSKKIILTVSPVRHLKDTLPLNAVSKSVLRLACHYLQESIPNIYYFPAYELINDDLRDYRFYTDDMLHINSQGEVYVWNKFVDSCLSKESQEIMKKWERVASKLKHQFFNTQTPHYQDFLKKTLLDLQEIGSYINLSDDIAKVESLLADA